MKLKNSAIFLFSECKIILVRVLSFAQTKTFDCVGGRIKVAFNFVAYKTKDGSTNTNY